MHLNLTIHHVYLCGTTVDFRKSIGGLSVLVEQQFGLHLFDGSLFVFVNRHRNQLKILYWDRNGFCLWQKRLETHKFIWPKLGADETVALTQHELAWLLEGIDLWSKNRHQPIDFNCVS